MYGILSSTTTVFSTTSSIVLYPISCCAGARLPQYFNSLAKYFLSFSFFLQARHHFLLLFPARLVRRRSITAMQFHLLLFFNGRPARRLTHLFAQRIVFLLSNSLRVSYTS